MFFHMLCKNRGEFKSLYLPAVLFEKIQYRTAPTADIHISALAGNIFRYKPECSFGASLLLIILRRLKPVGIFLLAFGNFHVLQIEIHQSALRAFVIHELILVSL